MKNNTYHVKHDLGDTSISYPDEGIPIKLNINMTFLTFSYILSLIFVIGYITKDVIEMVYKITGG